MLFRLAEVTKSYGGTEILRGVSFQMNPGEKVGLVGRNGAGKTTVFRLITGEEAPDTGDVVKASGLKLGLLTQHVDFEPGETVHTAALAAFADLQRMDAEMREIEKLMETDHSRPVLDRYADLQIAFEQADGFSYSARAEAVLLGLGFTRDTWGNRADKLSGGQKNRLAMARLLLSGVDVLLLDEPTNHLDVSAVEWLENYLRDYDTGYVVISHDRYFLDRTTTRIIEMENGKAVTYKGNYSKFLVERALRREQQRREYANQRQFIAKTQDFIRRNLEGQKTKQAKSRRTLLERIDLLDAVTSETHGGSFGLKAVERTGNNVLTTEALKIGYSDDRPLAGGIDISLHRGETLGIIGGNGSGKTTFLKTILGRLRELRGTYTWGTKTDIGYYSQNLEDLHPGNEVIQELRRVAPLADNGTLRSFLARFLFFDEEVFKKVADLSGGEKGRLALAKLIYSRKNVLVLDEPTNHLDIPAREALEAALDEYDGTIITVSHDRFFLDKIATQVLAFELGARVEVFNGNYTEYHDWRDRSVPPAVTGGFSSARPLSNGDVGVAGAEAGASAGKSSDQKEPLSKNQLARTEARIAEIEEIIAALEIDAAKLTSEMARPEVAADFPRLRDLTARLEENQRKIKGLYDEWQEWAGQIEGM